MKGNDLGRTLGARHRRAQVRSRAAPCFDIPCSASKETRHVKPVSVFTLVWDVVATWQIRHGAKHSIRAASGSGEMTPVILLVLRDSCAISHKISLLLPPVNACTMCSSRQRCANSSIVLSPTTPTTLCRTRSRNLASTKQRSPRTRQRYVEGTAPEASFGWWSVTDSLLHCIISRSRLQLFRRQQEQNVLQNNNTTASTA